MVNKDFLETLSNQLANLMPMAEEIRRDMRTKIEHQLRTSFERFDLLSRSEFAAQSNALQRAQDRIAELEQMLTDLEARLASLETHSAPRS